MITGIQKFSKLGMTNLTKKDAIELFQAIDVDQSGEIDYTEFIAAFMGIKLRSDEKYLRQAFQ
jgi:calcium-dependent protein kinase